jgi:hypothetical protein
VENNRKLFTIAIPSVFGEKHFPDLWQDVGIPKEATPMTALPDRSAIAAKLFADETASTVRALAAEATLRLDEQKRVAELARQLGGGGARGAQKQGGIDAFMQEYSLSSEEGVVLMCLAEALLRIPDTETADRLIADKVGGKDWERHLGQSESLFVNASAWGLMLTGRFVDLGQSGAQQCGRLSQEAGDALGRARHPQCHEAGDAHHGQAVRPWADDRRGAVGRQAAGGGGLPLLLRHAGRGGLHHGGCGTAISPPTRMR